MPFHYPDLATDATALLRAMLAAKAGNPTAVVRTTFQSPDVSRRLPVRSQRPDYKWRQRRYISGASKVNGGVGSADEMT